VAKPQLLRCAICGKEYKPEENLYTCPDCGLDGTFHVLYDYEKAAKEMTKESLRKNGDFSLWRYKAVLPIEKEESIPHLAVGWTPLYRSKKLAESYGVKEVYVKDDGRNPTGSLKDRASAVGVAKAMDYGRKAIACASTGNAASSLSGFAAVSGLKSIIFVPESAPVAKITQLLVYGAHVVLVKGTYEKAFDLATEAIERWGWYNRNCAINPYLVEGKKTCAIEIAEQLDWNVPDFVFVSVGDGCIISSLYKGFSDLVKLGLADRVPHIVGVQAEGASPIYKAFREGSSRVKFSPASTVADSISVGAPRNWAKALNAVRQSNGEMMTVKDEEILSAIPELARATGVFGEPAGVTAFAGFRKAAREGKFPHDARIALIVTGNGLKDIEGARKAVGQPIVTGARLESLELALRERNII